MLVKMDVEGTEWDLIPHLLATNTAHLIDELFLECHSWAINATTEQVCIDLINHVRSCGVYCHSWV